MNYIYDGSFQGFLTAIYESYIRREVPQRILAQNNLQESLFDRNISIETDIHKAFKVKKSIVEKISPSSFKLIFYVFLSELDESDIRIYRYLQLGWKLGKKVESFLSDENVLYIMKVSKKVAFEVHRMLGLIRFRSTGNEIYYAPIGPDFNIALLLAPHFQNRFSTQHWIIHDVKRHIAVMCNQKDLLITALDADFTYDTTEAESAYQNLWKEYFRNIAIQSRTNPKLQKQFMPIRYWKHLTEV